MKPEALWEVAHARQLSASRFLAAGRTRSEWYQILLQLFERYDYLVLPTAQVFAFPASLPWPNEIAGRR